MKKIIEFLTPRGEEQKAYLALMLGVYCAIGTSVISLSTAGLIGIAVFTVLAVFAGVFLRIAVDIIYSWTKEKK